MKLANDVEIGVGIPNHKPVLYIYVIINDILQDTLGSLTHRFQNFIVGDEITFILAVPTLPFPGMEGLGYIDIKFHLLIEMSYGCGLGHQIFG